MITKILNNWKAKRAAQRFNVGFRWCQVTLSVERQSVESVRSIIEHSKPFDSFDEGALAALRLHENKL